MPRASSQDTIRRQWAILRRLTTTPVPVREIHEHLRGEGYEVTRRTVERDLQDLSGAFNIVATEGMPQGWAWNRKGRRTHLVGMDEAEAFTLVTAGKVLSRMLPQVLLRKVSWLFESAREHVPSERRKGVARWSALTRYIPSGEVLLPPEISAGVMATVQDALLRGKCVRARYYNPYHGRTNDSLLHPVALLLQGSTPYLLATLGDDDATPFRYAIHRFESVDLDDTRARRPRGFDLDDFLASGGDRFGCGDTFRLEAEVRGNLATLIAETPISEDQRLIEKGDHHLLKATVMDSWNLQFWILSQSPSLTVRKPTKLRRHIRESLESALTHYSS